MRYTPGCEGKFKQIALALKTEHADKTDTPL